MKNSPTLWTPEATVHEVQIVYKRPIYTSLKHIGKSCNAYQIFLESVDQSTIDVQECFWLMTLNFANRVLSISQIAAGAINSVVISVPIIAQTAILTHASFVILFHNHPSGNLHFSQSDIQLTQKVVDGLRNLDIAVLDHLVVTSEGYISMADEGKM